MKHLNFSLFILISLFLSSCSNHSVEDIAGIINNAAEQKAKEADGANEARFMIPDGNIFANPEIKAIIVDNNSYELSFKDKVTLKDAVDKLYPETISDLDALSTPTGKILYDMNQAIRNKNLAYIDAAKTLGDLL